MDRTYTVAVPFGSGSIAPIISGLRPRGNFGPNYVKRLNGRLNLILDSDVVSDAVPGRKMMEAIQRLTITPVGGGDPVVDNIEGQFIRWGQWPLTLRAPIDPQDIPANSNTTNDVEIPWTLPFADMRTKQPKDGGLPATYLANGAINLNWQADTFFGVGQTIDAATTLFLTFIYEERMDVDVGERTQYTQIGLTTLKGMNIPPAMITDMLLCPGDSSALLALSEDSFASIQFSEDGDEIHGNTKPDDLVDDFNGEMITDVLGQLPNLDAAQTEFIPLIWCGRNNVDMGDRAIADTLYAFTGTTGAVPPTPQNLQFFVRQILDVDISDSAKQINAASPDVSVGLAIVGLQVAAKMPPDVAHNVVRPATNSKVPLHGDKGARFGRFMRRTVNPSNLLAAAHSAVKQAAAK